MASSAGTKGPAAFRLACGGARGSRHASANHGRNVLTGCARSQHSRRSTRRTLHLPHICTSRARVARYYDPATAQFLTGDPIESVTQQPYQYANGDPLDQVDPLGLCGHWYDVACQVGSAATATGHFVEDHKVAVGIGLGVLSVATGGAGFLVEGALLTTTLSGAAVATGAGAAVLDSADCANGSTAACVGAGLGFAGALAGGGPLVASVGGIAETSTAGAVLNGFFGGLSLNFGAAGLVFDATMAIANQFCGSESNS